MGDAGEIALGQEVRMRKEHPLEDQSTELVVWVKSPQIHGEQSPANP